MKNDVIDLCLTPSEKRIVASVPPSARDIKMSKKQASDYLNGLLDIEVQVTKEDGSVGVMTYGERLTLVRLKYMEEHPEEWKLTELTMASAGNKKELEVKSTNNADFFSCIDSSEIVEVQSDDTQTK